MMKKYTTALFLTTLVHCSSAFVAPPSSSHHATTLLRTQRRPLIARMSAADAEAPNGTPESTFDDLLESTELSKAVSYLRQHPSLEISRERWQRIFDAIEVRTAEAEENHEVNTRVLMEYPPQSPARMDMTRMYEALLDLKHLKLFGAVNQPLASGSHTVTPTILETITHLSMKALTPKPTNTVLIAGIALAGLEGLASVMLGWNFNFLVLSTLLLAFMDRMLLNGAVFESFWKAFSPGISDKILKHEAGHFLCSYLLGNPVEGCVLSAWAALQDARFDKRNVSAGTSFFDPILSREMNVDRKVSKSSVDKYSIIVMGGIAAEAINFGQADGGAGDEMALVTFLSALNKSGGGKVWTENLIRNQARWGALQAVLIIQQYKPCYDALVDALERGGTLGDCIHAIEQAGRQSNLQPLERPLGYILDQGPYGEWTTEMPKEADVAEAAPATTATTKSLSVQESSEQLQEYRTQVEERLRAIDARIQEIEES